MKEVFILGAGFSRWLCEGMPLLSDLIDDISEQTTKLITQDDSLTVLFFGENNIEKLLSYLTTEYPWKKREELDLHKSIAIRIINEITEKILRVQNDPLNMSDASLSKERQSLFDYFHENVSEIITFNYDTLLENNFENHYGLQDWYELYKLPMKLLSKRSTPNEPTPSFFSKYEDETKKYPTITKLHGSINWLFNGYYDSLDTESVYYYKIAHSLVQIVTPINRKGLIPFIVPPTSEKNMYIKHSLLRNIWQTAREKIENAEIINIIGYSFPTSDIYFDLFLKTTVNPYPMINIIDINESAEFEEKIRKYFQPVLLDLIKTKIKFYTGENAVNNFVNQIICKKHNGKLV